jgi:hypothetical protein
VVAVIAHDASLDGDTLPNGDIFHAGANGRDNASGLVTQD